MCFCLFGKGYSSPVLVGAKEVTSTEGDYQHTAAAMKMFGRLTRKDEEWFPSGLLCKRFNVPPPRKNAPRPTAAARGSGMSDISALPFLAHLPGYSLSLILLQLLIIFATSS